MSANRFSPPDGASLQGNGPTLSVVLPVKNEETRVASCLGRLDWADEVIVVDMYSADRTPEICREYPNVKFFQHAGGPLGLIRLTVLYGISQCKGDWILFTAVDEVITPELRRSIQQAMRQSQIGGYRIYLEHWFCGNRLRFGEWNGYFLHLVRRQGLKLLPEGAVHEEPWDVVGPVEKLDGVMRHYSHPSIHVFIEKLNRYTSQEAGLTLRQEPTAPRIPARWNGTLWMIWFPIKEFARRYLKSQGYRDGVPGLIAAALMAFYVFAQEAKLWEVRERQRHTIGDIVAEEPKPWEAPSGQQMASADRQSLTSRLPSDQ